MRSLIDPKKQSNGNGRSKEPSASLFYRGRPTLPAWCFHFELQKIATCLACERRNSLPLKKILTRPQVEN